MKCLNCQSDNTDTARFCSYCAKPLSRGEEVVFSKTVTIHAPAKVLAKGSLVAGKYRIVESIGRGGMGIVYRAEDEKLQRPVALKFLPEEMANDRQAVERLQREARSASALNHPNICTIYDIDEYEGQHFIALELMEGKTLREYMLGHRLEVDQTVDLAIQIASGLDAAHAKGIIHRDIKPGNIFMTESGQAKILDFGLAKLLPERKPKTEEKIAASLPTMTAEEFLTSPGVAMGTMAYMSPEQALGKDLDARTDLFALGVVLYEMATGILPFRGDTSAALFDGIMHRVPTPAVRLNPDLPEEMERIIDKALEKDREVRYQSATEILADLKRLKRRRDLGKSQSLPAPAGRILPRRKAKRWIAATVLLAILAITAWWYLSRRKAELIKEPLRTVPFTALPGHEDNARFSSDGKFVAFEWDGPAEDNWDIYIKQVVRGEEPFRLTRDPAADLFPVWSPDGGEVAFVRVSEEIASICTVPFPQGAERKLYDLETPSDADHLSWSPDGRWLAFSEKSAPDSPTRIYLLSLETRQTIPLTSPPPKIDGDFAPEFSPDGKRIAFVRRTNYGIRDIWMQPLPSGEATRLTPGPYVEISRPVWTADGSEVVFHAGEKEDSTLIRIPIIGGAPQPVVGIGENAHAPAIWRNFLVFSQWSVARQGLWRMRGPGYKGKDRSPAPVLPSTRQDWFPVYSPDGKKLAFSSTRSGFTEIWICNSDGTEPVQLTNSRKRASVPLWAPDGRQIFFYQQRGEYCFVDTDGGIPQRLTDEKSEGGVLCWSSDGRWVYFISKRTGSPQVWKIPSDGGKAVQITKGGALLRAMESFDGKMLYYFKPGQRADVGPIWKIPLEGGEETPVLEREISWGDWALRPEGIYFSTMTGKKYSIEFLSFQTGKVIPFYQEETPNVRLFLTISPDGEWLVYTEYIRPESDLMLVENFR